jgi:hypothetical protein
MATHGFSPIYLPIQLHLTCIYVCSYPQEMLFLSQSRSSQQSPTVYEIVREHVQAKMTQFRVETIKLRDKVNFLEQLLATLTGICAPPRCPLGSSEDSSLSPF